jgi:aldehyde:ferredoxin oxidoreductase
MGKLTGEADALLRSEVGDPKAEVAQYGPAAERGVLFSSIVSMANRTNGRTGMGLVMASKNLKAIVVRGKAKPKVANPQALAALSKLGLKWMPENPDVAALGKYGTASVVLPQNMYGTLPTRNYTEGQFEQAEKISGEVMYDTVLKKRDTCYACVVRCKR